MRKSRLRVSATMLALATLTAACSTRAPDSASGGGGGGGEGEVATGTGVTADTIKLGQLTDLTGVFAALSRSITNAQQMYFEEVNADGGICGRQVELVTRDHGYNVQTAVSLYQGLAGEVLGLVHVIGSPINAALLQNYTQDEMLAIPASWASTLLENDQIMIVGTTYDYEMINLVDYMFDQGMLAEGDTIGHIFLEGEYGQNGLMGTKFAAEQRGLRLEERQIRATDTDVTAVVNDLKNVGVKAIALTTTPTQTASAAATNATGGAVPLLGNNPVFSPGLMDTSAGPALAENLYLATSWDLPSVDDTETQEIIASYEEKFPGAQLDGGVTWGYGSAAAFTDALRAACDSGDLTRAGLLEAFRSLDQVEVPTMPTLDYSEPGASPATEIMVYRPDAAAVGNATAATTEPYTGPTAEAYEAPAAGEGEG